MIGLLQRAKAASVRVENGVVKFYFATAKADVAAGATPLLLQTSRVGDLRRACLRRRSG